MAACLGAIVIMQVANVLLCRTEYEPTFSVGIRGNRLLLLGVAVELLLLTFIIYTPWGNQIFAAAPLPAEAWLFMLPFPLAMLVLEEVRKACVRHSQERPPREAIVPHCAQARLRFFSTSSAPGRPAPVCRWTLAQRAS